MSLTRSQIARTLSAEIGLSLKNSGEVVSALIAAITRALEAGEEVRIRNFGRFWVMPAAARRRKGFSRVGTVPDRTRKFVRFTCSKSLRVCLQDEVDAYDEDLSGLNAVVKQLQKNLAITAKIQRVLEAHCRWVTSEGSKGKRADLSRFDLKGADLFGSNLRSANLSGASLPSADLSDCDLENAGLDNADLKGASLAWSNLQHASLRGACLREADLKWADLRWANFSEADLSGANLYGADLNDAILDGTELRGARLKNTILEKKNTFSPAALTLRLRKKLKF